MLARVIKIIDDGDKQGMSKERISDVIKFFFYNNLYDVETEARAIKICVDTNQSIHQQQISQFCTGEMAQYKGILESLLKSECSKDITKDIEFLTFALKLMQERLDYKCDIANLNYSKCKEVLEYVQVLLNA